MIARVQDVRLAPLEAPYAPEIAKSLERMMGGPGIEPLGLFRTIAHNPALLDKLRSTGSYLLNFGTLDAREREIVILRTCARCRCEYEWGVHVSIFSEAVGLTEQHVRATLGEDTTIWSEREHLLIRLVDELHDSSTISDELWALLPERWQADQLVELVTLVGQYHSVSYVANALGVAKEEFAARF